MAKKAKASKAKAKKTKARATSAGMAPVTPTYLKDGQTYTMGLHNVVRALGVIEKHGHMAKFVRAAKKSGAAGTFDAKTVNFVKDFMVKQKMHNDPIGKHIVNARQPEATAMTAGATGSYNCNF
jgi:hypothetical protein